MFIVTSFAILAKGELLLILELTAIPQHVHAGWFLLLLVTFCLSLLHSYWTGGSWTFRVFEEVSFLFALSSYCGRRGSPWRGFRLLIGRGVFGFRTLEGACFFLCTLLSVGFVSLFGLQ